MPACTVNTQTVAHWRGRGNQAIMTSPSAYTKVKKHVKSEEDHHLLSAKSLDSKVGGMLGMAVRSIAQIAVLGGLIVAVQYVTTSQFGFNEGKAGRDGLSLAAAPVNITRVTELVALPIVQAFGAFNGTAYVGPKGEKGDKGDEGQRVGIQKNDKTPREFFCDI